MTRRPRQNHTLAFKAKVALAALLPGDRCDRRIALQDAYRDQATKPGPTSDAIALVDFLFERPAIA
jgi:hypothetical protein